MYNLVSLTDRARYCISVATYAIVFLSKPSDSQSALVPTMTTATVNSKGIQPVCH